MSATHVPVLLAEVLTALTPKPGALVVDGTFGAGGYTRALLETGARVIGIDRDPAALNLGAALANDRLRLALGRFSEMERLAAEPVDGVALDLGVSSMQLDQPARGFSFRADGPLDMRMGADGPTAADLVNNLGEAELADLIWRWGEERRSRAVARAIVAARPLATTGALAHVVRGVVGGPKPSKTDPATRTFQALRIAVNDELGELDRGLEAAERLLKPGGRLAVVTFHSLEDRAVKLFLRARSGGEAAGSRHLPTAPKGPAPSFRLLNGGKPVEPGAAEIAANPRARSARLRAAERTEAPAWNPSAERKAA